MAPAIRTQGGSPERGGRPGQGRGALTGWSPCLPELTPAGSLPAPGTGPPRRALAGGAGLALGMSGLAGGPGDPAMLPVCSQDCTQGTCGLEGWRQVPQSSPPTEAPPPRPSGTARTGVVLALKPPHPAPQGQGGWGPSHQLRQRWARRPAGLGNRETSSASPPSFRG